MTVVRVAGSFFSRFAVVVATACKATTATDIDATATKTAQEAQRQKTEDETPKREKPEPTAPGRTDADAGRSLAWEVGTASIEDNTGAIKNNFARPVGKAELERIVDNAIEAEGGRRRAGGSGTLRLDLAVLRRSRAESFIAVNGELSLGKADDARESIRFRANAIGFRPVPKGEGAADAYRELVRRAVRDTIHSLVVQRRIPTMSKDDLRATIAHSSDAEARLLAASELAEKRDRADFELFLRLLRDTEPRIARRSVGALVALKDKRAVPAIIDFAARKDPQTLREVIYALADLADEKAIPFLWTIEKGHEAETIRAAAREAIEQLRERR